MTAPSGVLKFAQRTRRGRKLALESPALPSAGEKQRKIQSGALGGDRPRQYPINAACQRIYQGMLADPIKPNWKELCYLCFQRLSHSSDGKTLGPLLHRLKIAEKPLERTG